MIRIAKFEDAPIVSLLLLDAMKDIAYQLTGEQKSECVLKVLETFIKTKGNRFSFNHIQVKEVTKRSLA